MYGSTDYSIVDLDSRLLRNNPNCNGYNSIIFSQRAMKGKISVKYFIIINFIILYYQFINLLINCLFFFIFHIFAFVFWQTSTINYLKFSISFISFFFDTKCWGFYKKKRFMWIFGGMWGWSFYLHHSWWCGIIEMCIKS